MIDEEVYMWVKKYYPHTATKALVLFNNEYNDEGYDIDVATILVYDKDDNELVPAKEDSINARKNLPSMIDYIYSKHKEYEYAEDIVIDIEASNPYRKYV